MIKTGRMENNYLHWKHGPENTETFGPILISDINIAAMDDNQYLPMLFIGNDRIVRKHPFQVKMTWNIIYY